MTTESYLNSKLRKFSILDIALIKSVYFILGLLICSLYPKLLALDWFFYLVISLLCAFPLYVHLFSQQGDFFEKTKKYLKTNNPSYQMLLLLSVFFFALMVTTFFPVITSARWWVYIIIIICLAIKPFRTSKFW